MVIELGRSCATSDGDRYACVQPGVKGDDRRGAGGQEDARAVTRANSGEVVLSFCQYMMGKSIEMCNLHMYM